MKKLFIRFKISNYKIINYKNSKLKIVKGY